MVDSATGGRTSDANGLSLMVGDSHTASNNYGLNGAQFSNIPKQKFLFFLKFNRPTDATGSTWLKTIGFQVKNIDRPRVSFKQETLNQYNRKRIVQTGHEFESLQLKFHDSVSPDLRNMFKEYYQYYYGDSAINATGQPIYDIVTGEQYQQGKWGFLPPMVENDYGYFFSSISVYQLYNGLVEQFDLLNPKISMFNPDDFDYSAGAASGEIQMSFDFEGIVYQDPVPLTGEVATMMGIDRGQFWDVINDVGSTSPGAAISPNSITSSLGSVIGNVALSNLKSLVTGQGTQSVQGVIGSITGAYDANRGLAVGITAVKGIKDLVSGNTSSGKQGIQGLLKGALYGGPGGLF